MSIASWMENGRGVTSRSDTIFAVATARGAAGVAVIRISGEAADAALAALTRKALPDYRHAALRTLFARDGSEIDEALILRFENPRWIHSVLRSRENLRGARSMVGGSIWLRSKGYRI